MQIAKGDKDRIAICLSRERGQKWSGGVTEVLSHGDEGSHFNLKSRVKLGLEDGTQLGAGSAGLSILELGLK